MDPREFARDRLALHGLVTTPPVESACLAGNAAGDAHQRELPVYLPPGWNAPGAELPVVFLLAGFTGRGQNYLETHPWRRGVVARFDAAVAAGECPPAILVLPDCFTRLGGSQYVNSAYLGPYEDHVALELTAFVEEHFPVLPGRCGVVGKSSGGFGAMHLSMRHPERFPAAASLSGDCHFEVSYAASFHAALRGLLAHDSDPARFLEAFATDPDLSGDGHAVIDLCAMSACYSPNLDSPVGFDLPVDVETGERIGDVWERWLAFDPLHACVPRADAWRKLECLHLECGLRDEFHLQFALRVLSRRLTDLDVPHHHEEHEGGHFGIDERYLRVLPRVIEVLAG